MELNNNIQTSSVIYQKIANEKSQLQSVDKNDKSTFEKSDTLELSNNKNTQRDEESKKIENMVSSAPNLNNAQEELNKNNNLNSMLASELQISDLASKMTQIADVVADPQFQEVTADLIDSIVGQIPEVISYQANAQGVQTQNAVLDALLNIKA